MGCPYLTEVTMVFCRASPVKKLVPGDKLHAGSRCDGAEYQGCPLFREALDRSGASLEESEAEVAAPPEATKRRTP
jgi:hypothetical protein